MSNYKFLAKHRETGEELTFDAFDNYFGEHQYGYRIDGGTHIMTEKEFNDFYEPLDSNL